MPINKLTAGSKNNPFNSKGKDVAESVNALIDQGEDLELRLSEAEQQIAGLPAEIDAAGTAAMLVDNHNSSPTAHPELTAFITSEADRAELAANSAEVSEAIAMSAGFIYETVLDGAAARVDGEYFWVVSATDTNVLDLYLMGASTATATGKSTPSTASIDSLKGPNPAGPLPQFFESTDPQLASVIVTSPNGKVLASVPDPRVANLESTAVTSDFFESLDPLASGAIVVSKSGGVIVSIGDDSSRISALELEVESARGSRNSLSDRLSAGLTDFGDIKLATLNSNYMAECHNRLYRIKSGISTEQLVIVLIGDSYIDGTAYWVENFAKQMQTEFGNAGAGFVGFGWWSASSGTWTSGSQPVGISGATRRDIVSLVQIIGAWSCTYNSASTGAPALYRAVSSEVGAYIRFGVPSNHNECRLFYSGDGTGVIAVSWDDGSTYGADIPITSTPSGFVDLAGIPLTATTARIKVVSGNVGLCGVDLKSSSVGVRISRLGGSGSQTAQWAAVDAAQWGSQLAAFEADAIGVLLGTNDQIFSVNPDLTGQRMATITNNIKSACPVADVWQITPAENANTPKAYVMPLYALELRKVAVNGGHGYVDLQPSFGDPSNAAEQYEFGSSRPYLDADNVHPSSRGGYSISAANYRFITN